MPQKHSTRGHAAVPDHSDDFSVGEQDFGLSETRLVAYGFWCERGCPEGTPEIDWFRAEHHIAAKLAQQVAPKVFKVPHVVLSGGPRVSFA